MKSNLFLEHAGVRHPVICGPMYPCSNPELVAAVSDSGGLGIVQPISLTYVHGFDFIEGIKYIQSLTPNPVGMNLLIEKSSSKYRDKMEKWLYQALENNIKFFITSLGKPDWVVDIAHRHDARVYHDVTEAKWADKAIDCGVDGLIAVNNRAGGHAGGYESNKLYDELSSFNLPVVCAGGVGNGQQVKQALDTGYSAVQLGTRFIATEECSASQQYKEAIINATANDIVLTEKLTGVPVSVINTPYVRKTGLKPGVFEKWMLNNPRLKHYMRILFALKSIKQLKRSNSSTSSDEGYWQSGKSADAIHEILKVTEVMDNLTCQLK